MAIGLTFLGGVNGPGIFNGRTSTPLTGVNVTAGTHLLAIAVWRSNSGDPASGPSAEPAYEIVDDLGLSWALLASTWPDEPDRQMEIAAWLAPVSANDTGDFDMADVGSFEGQTQGYLLYELTGLDGTDPLVQAKGRSTDTDAASWTLTFDDTTDAANLVVAASYTEGDPNDTTVSGFTANGYIHTLDPWFRLRGHSLNTTAIDDVAYTITTSSWYALLALELRASAGDPELFITASFTEPNESLTGAATVAVTGSASFTEPNETLSSETDVLNTIDAEFTEPNETLSASIAGATLIIAEFTEPNEILSSEIDNPVVLVGIQVAEPVETLTSAVSPIVGLDLSATDPNETLSSLTGVLVTADLDVTEPNERLNSFTHHGDTPPTGGGAGHRRINISSIGIGI